MPFNIPRARQCLQAFNLTKLFIEEMGWDHPGANLEVALDGAVLKLTAIAQKRGLGVYLCLPLPGGELPDYATRRKIETLVRKSIHEHLIIFTNADCSLQKWQWVRRETGKPTTSREFDYGRGQSGEALLQRMQGLMVEFEEEENLTIFDVVSRVRATFNLERVTKHFYDRFKSEHTAFTNFLQGIPDEGMQRWYVSVTLNRLMFIYFIQKKQFLNNDPNYLRNKLVESKFRGQGRFYTDFLCPLFFEGFAKKEAERSPEVNRLLGKVPYLNGGIFQRHQIEEQYGQKIQITDAAFERLFDFFDQYRWHLDERPLRADNEINPDVLGYIFEKYINQKQMGAYYTKEDITGYISKYTVLSYLFDEARRDCRIAFEGQNPVWRLLQVDQNRYIYPAVRKGTELPLPPEIAIGIGDVSKRGEWNKHAAEEYALPTEIWREVVARRQRYEEVRARLDGGEIHEINDFITYNLDIQQLVQDVVESCEGPELLRAFWKALGSIKILDPTCGSGAFLFAALNILEPLYEVCLERMRAFLDELERSSEKHRPEKYKDFREILAQVARHPNLRYFILKSIIVHNLYGVDIIEEAVEICKLRLFLKLVAQVEDVDHIEPLPDIDFNVRAGNTLVGFASQAEVRAALTQQGAQGKMMLFEEDRSAIQRIEHQAEDIARLFHRLQQQQTEVGGEVTPEDKQILRQRLKILEDELNQALARQYGVDPVDARAYAQWTTTHKPFHWFVEFYDIMKSGGFDVIIGNPPYVEYSKIRNEYTITGVECIESGNLYAFIIERCLKLQSTFARIGMIIQLSAFCTPRMDSFQNVLFSKTSLEHISFFDDRPGKLFDGLEHIRVAIVIAQVGSSYSPIIVTSRYIKFATEARPFLFETIDLTVNTQGRHNSSVLKISEPIENEIARKLWKMKHPLAYYLQDEESQNYVYYGYGFAYWGKILNFKSYFKGEKVTESTGDKYIYCRPELNRDIVVAVMNSSLFYWFYVNFSDGHNFTKHVIGSFPFEIPNSLINAKLKTLCSNLMIDLHKNSRRKIAFYKSTGKIEYEEFVQRLSKPIIDDIDRVLAKHYGFTDEELDFIINYDIKYRMGGELEDDTEK
jgi:hypothetical protein